jgi:hypothetical protein
MGMTAEGPVADFELDELRKQAYSRGWCISRTGDGRVSAVREDGSAAITVGTAGLMKVALHNELWRPLTGGGPRAARIEPGSSG